MQVVFVCTGNTCRSPMAECYARAYLQKKGCSDIECCSAGIAAMTGDTASLHAVELMGSWGLDLSTFRSRVLSRLLLESSEYVVVMGRTHRQAIVNAAPEFASKIVMLMDEGDVPDPYGGSLDVYSRVFDAMRPAIEFFIDKLILK